MRRTSWIQLMTFSVLVSLLPGWAWADDSLKETIQSREVEWAAAYNAHDETALGDLYTADALLIPPGMEPVKGREAISRTLAGLFATLRDLALVTDEVRPLGPDHAVEIGHSTYHAIQQDGSLAAGIDNYVVVWHKGKDGVWSLMTDTFNTR